MADNPDSPPLTVTGFHGTKAIHADSIIKKGFQAGTGEGLFLGDGSYFFDDLQYAIDWCSNHKRLKRERLAFFRATVSYGKSVDLNQPTMLESLQKWNSVLESRDDLDRFLQANDAKKLTIAVAINEYCKYVKSKTGVEPHTVRYARRVIRNKVYPLKSEKRFWIGGIAFDETTICVRPYATATHIRDVAEIAIGALEGT